jgi:hypothetical protein
MSRMDDLPPSMPGLSAAELESIENIPENIPERKKTEKRVVVDEDELEEKSASSSAPAHKKKKKKKIIGTSLQLSMIN